MGNKDTAAGNRAGGRRDRANKTGSDEFGRFIRRLLKSYARKAREAEVDIAALEQLAEIQAELDERTAEVVMALRSQGESWERIGQALGMTRSAAYKKFIARPGIADAEGARKPGGQPGALR